MSIKNTISISEARKKIFNIADEVQKPNKHYTLTQRGRPKAVVISAEEFELWQETLETIKDFPDLDKEVAETEKAFRTGEYKSWSTLKDLKKDWGFAIADKSTKKYGVRSKNKTKSKKKEIKHQTKN